MLARFSSHFELLHHDQRGLRGFQDIVLLRKARTESC
jgi:hypothetical protein